MASQAMTVTVKKEQADVIDVLAERLGGRSAAVQALVDFYLTHFQDCVAADPTPEPVSQAAVA